MYKARAANWRRGICEETGRLLRMSAPCSHPCVGKVRFALGLCLVGLLWTEQGSAQALGHAVPDNGAWHVQAGWQGGYQRYQLGYETSSFWQYDLGHSGTLMLSAEIAMGSWHAGSGRHPSSLWQVAAMPTLRWWWRPHYYAEVGTGPSYISRTWFGDKQLSTRLQFNSFVGVGLKLGQAHRLGLRYTHVSNASIKRPNPGLNLLEVSYAYQF